MSTLNAIPWDGLPISKPGIYANVGMAAYHHQLTVTPSISSGGLRKIENESPAHYYVSSYLNPDREPQLESEALILGRATHHLVGGEQRFFEQFVIRPDAYPEGAEYPGTVGKPKPWHGGANWCKGWLADQGSSGKTVITSAQIDQIRGMADALERHPAVREGLLKGEVERSIVWQDEKTGVWLKARPDVIPVESDMIVDLKTCASADHQSVCRALSDHGYHMQLALAYEGLKAVTGRRMTDFILVFVETRKPHAVSVKAVDLIDIEYGRRQLRRAIDRFAECLKTGEWPAYEDDDQPVTLTDSHRKRLAKEAEHSLLPVLDDALPQLEAAE